MNIINHFRKIIKNIKYRRLVNLINEKNNRGQIINQIILSNIYKINLLNRTDLPKITDTGFSIYSQTDEDGILLYIFSLIGIHKKNFVEIGISQDLESNCSNLAINFGWHGLFIDGNSNSINSAHHFFNNNPSTRLFPPKVLNAWITKDNIDRIITNAGFIGEIDLLSIDIDGMDFWIWKSIKSINPRVVVIEANSKLGLKSISVPYQENWRYNPDLYPHYHGASLPALIKLGREKEYRLIGTNMYGYNAFFVRSDIGKNIFPTVSVKQCRTHPTRGNDTKIYDKIKNLPFVKI